jgi:hypothetical protein
LSRGLPAAAETAVDDTGGREKLSLFAKRPEPLRIADLDKMGGPELPQLEKSKVANAHKVRESVR